MSDTFDPYYKWLGIAPKDQPPNHYRLLGLDVFEKDPEVIEAAANRQMTYVQGCATGPHVALSQKILNEVSQARLALLDPARKTAYDQQLRAKLGAVASPLPARGTEVQAVRAAAPPGAMPTHGTPALHPTVVTPRGVRVEPGLADSGTMQANASTHYNPLVTAHAAYIDPVTVPAAPIAGHELPAERSRTAARKPRGRTRVRFDWRFPLFIILAIGLIIAGIVIAQRLPAWIDQPQNGPPAGIAPR